MSEWTKQVYRGNKICYVNQVHEAIHAFLSEHCVCEYKYFISSKRWGFEIGSDRKAYLLIGDTVELATEYAELLRKGVYTLDLSDPALFDRILAFLKLNGLVRTEEETG